MRTPLSPTPTPPWRPRPGVLKTKITKIVTHFGASMYAYAESLEARQAMEARLRMQSLELRELVAAARQQRRGMLKAAARQLASWRYVVRREMATLQVTPLTSPNAT